jgi:hypothetical protein
MSPKRASNEPVYGDEGAGPEEPDDVIDDPENQAAATAIRDSTLGDEP